LRTSAEGLVAAATAIDWNAPIPDPSSVNGGERRAPRFAVDTGDDDEAIVPQPPYPTDNADMNAVPRFLKETRVHQHDTNRRAARASLTEAGGRAGLAVEVWSSVAYRARLAPRISVITALYNHADQIVDALESAAASRYGDYELIVVEDGSSDDSLRTVLRW